MSLADAERRLATRPRLQAAVSRTWLGDQAVRPPDETHPLYGLLEWAVDEAGIEAFLDGLEWTLGVPLGPGTTERARRLTEGDPPRFSDYWAAVDELSFGARLAACGLDVRFGDPARGEVDLLARDERDVMSLELTAPARTRELEALQAQITADWTLPFVARLVIGRETYRPIKRERDAIAARVHDAARSTPTTLVPVNLGEIVDPTLLRVTIEPSSTVGYVVSRPGDAFGHYDPVPDVEDAIARKRKQLRSHAAVVVAVDISAIGPDPHGWALRTAITAAWRAPLPTISSAPNVVGAIAFLRAVPGGPPTLPLWMANREWSDFEPRLLARVLGCLGVHR